MSQQYRTLEDDLRDAAYAAQYRNVYEGDDPKNAVPYDRFRWNHRPAEAGQGIYEPRQRRLQA